MKFTLSIELENEAMQTGDDVARALRKVAVQLRGHELNRDDGWKILDANGNTVGRWAVKRDAS